jgi:hypothetical protein
MGAYMYVYIHARYKSTRPHTHKHTCRNDLPIDPDAPVVKPAEVAAPDEVCICIYACMRRVFQYPYPYNPLLYIHTNHSLHPARPPVEARLAKNAYGPGASLGGRVYVYGPVSVGGL